VNDAKDSGETTQAITDSRVLAAMSHPLRRRLIDALTVDGPSTVGMLAARTGQAAGNVSHHLKVLSQAALIVEDPSLARDNREHWWRTAATGRRWSSTAFDDDPAGQVVAGAAESLNLEHHAEKVRTWYAGRDTAAHDWLDAAFATDAWLRLTPAELSELSEELSSLLRRWRIRALADDDERRSVFVFAHGVPAEP
jgi:DNA-binding transcriptional ArsR family regulator